MLANFAGILRKSRFSLTEFWQKTVALFFPSKTEIRNRRVFLRKLRTEFAEARLSERPVALLIVELGRSGTPRAGNNNPQRLMRRLLAEVLNDLVPSNGTWCRFDDAECAVWLRSVEFLSMVRIAEEIHAALQRLMITRIVSCSASIGLSYVEPRLGVDDGLYGHEALIGLTNEQLKRARSAGGGVVWNRPNL